MTDCLLFASTTGLLFSSVFRRIVGCVSRIIVKLAQNDHMVRETHPTTSTDFFNGLQALARIG